MAVAIQQSQFELDRAYIMHALQSDYDAAIDGFRERHTRAMDACDHISTFNGCMDRQLYNLQQLRTNGWHTDADYLQAILDDIMDLTTGYDYSRLADAGFRF